MKKLFVSIRNGDINTVKDLLTKNPELVSCTAKKPPAKDEGQSPLQVALKCGQYQIANYLLDHSADVNFIESENCNSGWRMPVLQCAVQCAVMSCRWNTCDSDGNINVFSSKEAAEQSSALLHRILDAGADIYTKDSFGNNCMERAVLDARQILPSYNHSTGVYGNDRKITEELNSDLKRIFDILSSHGINGSWQSHITQKPLKDEFAGEPVSEYMNS